MLELDEEITRNISEIEKKKYELNADYGTCDFELALINCIFLLFNMLL